MRIDDTDPDELDDRDLDDDGRPRTGPGSRRRKLSVLAGAVAAVAAGVSAIALTGGDDPTSSQIATSAEGADITNPIDAAPAIDVAFAPDGFPDYGSDYMGPRLDAMFQRTTDTGIRLMLQNSGDWQNFGFGMEEGWGVAVAATTVVEGDVVVETMAIDEGSIGEFLPMPGCQTAGHHLRGATQSAASV